MRGQHHNLYRLLREETDAEPIILYPSDTWTPHEAHDPAGLNFKEQIRKNNHI
ncbi:hypothetical protein [Brevibacillus formosus]|uniref:hypothetical protein n=1 Tax=Brevibacillus formosus TaxID=54913 RepID=UPI003F5324FD